MQKLVNEVKKEFPNVTLEQIFSCHIQDIEGSTVYVHLSDETNGEEDMVGEMDIKHFPKDPLYPELKPGCIFYWYIGYEDSEDNAFSLIRMSQAVWTQEMIDNAKKMAEGWRDLFKDPKIAD